MAQRLRAETFPNRGRRGKPHNIFQIKEEHTMKLFIAANRTGYTPEQVNHTLTVRDLIDALSDYSDDTPVYLKHDGGYTYGGIGWEDFQEEYDDDEDDDVD